MNNIVLLIPILLAIAILEKYTENKTSNQIMLIGIEVTIFGVAVIAIGGNIFLDNGVFISNLIGLIIVLIGFAASMYGFIKK